MSVVGDRNVLGLRTPEMNHLALAINPSVDLMGHMHTYNLAIAARNPAY
jgi:hypothetical protein